MSDLLIATQTHQVRLDGTVHRVRRARTVAHVDHPIAAAHPDLWRPFEVHYPDPNATLTPEPETVPDPPAPSAAKVRAWAKAEGLDVPARGPMPDDVIAAYQAAQAAQG